MAPFLRPRRARLASSTSLTAATAALLGAAIAACGGLEDADQLFGGTTSGGLGGGSTGTGGATSTGSSSGSTSTSASTGGASSTSTTSTASGGGTEDCLDGIDNDSNGAIDCADQACQAGFHCVDAEPAGGWKGHFYVTATTLPAPAAAPCPPDLQANGGEFATPAGPAQCSACSCGALQGAACSAPGIACFPNSTSCMGTPQDWTPAVKDGACHKPSVPAITFSLSCKLTSAPAVVAAGSCAPSPVDFPNKAPFQQRIDACGTDKVGGGCPSGKVCVPKGSGGPTESLCVRQDGAKACPAGWTQTIGGYTGAADTRSCDACACGAPGTGCTGGSYTFFDLDQCMAGGNDNPIPVGSSTCADVSALLDSFSWSVQGQLPMPKGSCPASGGAPTGSVQPTQPFTYCCK